MAESVPVPPTELVNGVVVNKGDTASLESAKVRYLGTLEALQTQGMTNQMTVYVDGSKAVGGVPT